MTERRRLQGFDAGWSDLSQGGTTIHGVEPTMKSLPGTTEWRTHLRTNSSRDGWHAVLAPDTNSRTSAGTLRARNTIRLTAPPRETKRSNTHLGRPESNQSAANLRTLLSSLNLCASPLMARIDAECLNTGFSVRYHGSANLFVSALPIPQRWTRTYRMSQGVRSGTSEDGRSPRPLDRGAAIRSIAPLSRAQFRPLGQINFWGHISRRSIRRFHHTPGLRALTNLANDRRRSQQGLCLECMAATPDSSQTCITRTRRPARIVREATLAAAILFGTFQAAAPSNQHLLCFLKRFSTVTPSVIQQEIVGARVEPQSTRNQFETSAGAQAPSDKLQTPAKGTA